jgi:hypothetical protein
LRTIELGLISWMTLAKLRGAPLIASRLETHPEATLRELSFWGRGR